MTKESDVLPDKEFLTRVAEDVGSLFPPASREREWLCKQIGVAIEQQIAHDQAEGERDKELLEHCRKLHRYSKWRDEEAGPPRRHPDWVYADWMYPAELTCDEDLGIIMGWGPPELLDDSSIPPQLIHDFRPFDDPPRPAAEVLPAYCFILAVVHDASRRGKGFQLLLDGVELPLSLQVCLDHQTDDGSGMQMTGFERETIEQALSAVKEEVGQQVQGATREQPRADDAPESPSPPESPDDGGPFYKPAHFKQWNIGDELLRRNSIGGKKYIKGKVRRQKQAPRTVKTTKWPRYWYSEPDAKKCWPERFVEE